MKRPNDQINCRVHTIRLMIAILSLIFISPVARADTFAQLKGYWQCQEDGQRSTLEFMSWGDSMTLYETGILPYFKKNPEIRLIETFAENISRETSMERRREAILTDLFLTGTNAVIESGMLVNLDMIGNRVGGITFGPKFVVIVVGRNKIVSDLGEAMDRIKNYAAPANAIRHGKKTPCVKTSYCMDCKSPDRICNVWTIHEKSHPKGRIRVILINQDLGL